MIVTIGLEISVANLIELMGGTIVVPVVTDKPGRSHFLEMTFGAISKPQIHNSPPITPALSQL